MIKFESGKTYDVLFLGVRRVQRIRVSSVGVKFDGWTSFRYVRVRKSDDVSFGWTRDGLIEFVKSAQEVSA
jgi:hypothetical protein